MRLRDFALPWPRPRLRLSNPLLFQSKILSLSLLYLLTTLPLSIYTSFSPSSSCPFSPTPPPPILPSTNLFSYPNSYRVHKHALPTARSACTSPIPFPEYEVAFREAEEICRNGSRPDSSALVYLERGGAGSFGGNFSLKERRSWFEYRGGDDDPVEIPCGFLKGFPLKESERLAMERCSGVVVASAVFGDHDKIRQPKGLGARTLETVCFFMFIDELTLRGLNRHNILSGKENEENTTIGAWRVLVLDSRSLPYEDPAMNGVIPKHLIHRLFPNSKFSIWIDAKIQLTVDPLLLLHSLLISKDVDMAISKHPFNVHTMEEAMATARWKKWGDVESLGVQMETYCENGLEPWSPSKLPYTTDVPDTALIARRHSTATNLFSCLLFNELDAFNPRDQLAFAYVRDLMKPKIKMNMFEVEVFEQIAIEYRHNLRREGDGVATKTKIKMQKRRRASSRDSNGSNCEHYLLKMWSETS